MLKLPETAKTFAANKTKAKRMQIVELLPAVRNLRMAGLGASGVDGNCLRASRRRRRGSGSCWGGQGGDN